MLGKRLIGRSGSSTMTTGGYEGAVPEFNASDSAGRASQAIVATTMSAPVAVAQLLTQDALCAGANSAEAQN